ncbi:hypothetical protein Q0P28_13765, partial [Staphylococcus aureus]|nr:hypothetical protein [Staphylococcus aureus]
DLRWLVVALLADNVAGERGRGAVMAVMHTAAACDALCLGSQLQPQRPHTAPVPARNQSPDPSFVRPSLSQTLFVAAAVMEEGGGIVYILSIAR